MYVFERLIIADTYAEILDFFTVYYRFSINYTFAYNTAYFTNPNFSTLLMRKSPSTTHLLWPSRKDLNFYAQLFEDEMSQKSFAFWYV